MTKIIHFNPAQQQNITTPQQNHIQLYSDFAGFQETPIDTFVSSKTKNSQEAKLEKERILTSGKDLYKSALSKKSIVEKKIFKGICRDYQYFQDKDGNPIIFEIDNLGRYVMVECDEKGNDKRRTTFTPQDGRIWSIETEPNEKIVFFNYKDNYTEIRRTTEPGLFKKGTKEVYCYSNHELCAYSQYEQKLFGEEKLTNRITF